MLVRRESEPPAARAARGLLSLAYFLTRALARLATPRPACVDPMHDDTSPVCVGGSWRCGACGLRLEERE